jgi:hypothetical protein
VATRHESRLRGPDASNANDKKDGRGERIRTSGLYVPNVALYQAKLHPDVGDERVSSAETAN